jgi:hypothetical protein
MQIIAFISFCHTPAGFHLAFNTPCAIIQHMTAIVPLLDRLLDPVGRALGPQAARRLLGLRADPDTQRQVDEFAQCANEGTLDGEQRSEYEALIAAATVIGVLQGKARAVLAAQAGK